MDNSKSTDALNTLVIVNNDRIEGYETARNETDHHTIKNLIEVLE